MDSIELARKVFDTEIEALFAMRNALDQTFVQIVDLITACRGKVVFMGIGKPGHICRKIVATMSSLGTPSFFLHPAEAQHGDLGMLSAEDIVIAISYSGESDEVIRLIPNIRVIGSKLIGITANANSTLANNCDVLQVLPHFEEACYMHLAPTSSTTVELVLGDALAIVAARKYGFSEKTFSLLHPAGVLGKKLILTVKDIMASGEQNSVVESGTRLEDAIVEMSKKQLGMICITEQQDYLCGIITDGDLRRIFAKRTDIYATKVDEIMTTKPHYIEESALAVEALLIMKEHRVTCLPVLSSEKKLVGTVTVSILASEGLLGM